MVIIMSDSKQGVFVHMREKMQKSYSLCKNAGESASGITNTALNTFSFAKTFGRYNVETIKHYANIEPASPQANHDDYIRWGKVAHDFLVPTRFLGAGIAALNCQIRKVELNTDNSFIKGAAYTARMLFSTAEVVLHLPEIVTTPIAHMVRSTITTLSAIKESMNQTSTEVTNASEVAEDDVMAALVESPTGSLDIELAGVDIVEDGAN